ADSPSGPSGPPARAGALPTRPGAPGAAGTGSGCGAAPDTGTPGARTGDGGRGRRRRPRAAARPSPVFSQGVLEHLQVHRLVSDHPLETPVRLLARLAAMEIGPIDAAVLPLPAVQGVEGDAVPADHVLRGHRAGVFLQDREDLVGGVASLACGHRVLWPVGRVGPYDSGWTSNTGKRQCRRGRQSRHIRIPRGVLSRYVRVGPSPSR